MFKKTGFQVGRRKKMAGQADQMLGFSWRYPIIMSSKKRKGPLLNHYC